METLKAIASRKSTRAFSSDKQIDKSTLDTILAAGCAAPVGKGDYPSLHLTIIQNTAVLEKINKAIQATLKMDRNLLYNAPVFVLVSASEKQMAPHIQYANAACIIENMLLAATDCGLGSVFLWGAPGVIAGNTPLCKELGVPEGFTPVCGMVLGYAAENNPAEKELGISLSVNYI